MQQGKSPGEDGIFIEHIRYRKSRLLHTIKDLYSKYLEEGDTPVDWNNAILILLLQTEDKTDIKNYRPFSLLSHLYELFMKIIANRLTEKRLIL